MYKRDKNDIDGMLEDIEESLHNISKSELITWIMELNFHNMSNSDLVEDYSNFYGDITQ